MNVRWLICSLVALGCPKPQETPPDAGSPVDAGELVDAGLEPVDAGPPTLRFTMRFTFVDGGMLETDQDGAPTQSAPGVALDPAQSLTLTFPDPLDDVRVRVMDWTDAVVASDDEAVAPDAGFTYRITFAQPLKSGRSYSLLIDSEAHDTFTDSKGHVFDEVRKSFKIAGEVQPEPGAPAKKKRKKR